MANTLRNMDIMDYPDYPGKTPCLHLGLGTPTLVAGGGANVGITRLLRFIASVTPGGQQAAASAEHTAIN